MSEPGEAMRVLVAQLNTYSKIESMPVSDRMAAVLVPLFEDDLGVVRVVLTQRCSNMRSHGGEVCLPGGKRDPGDKDDDVVTALREAQEELGLDPATVTVLLSLPPLLSKHYLSVTPVIATIPSNFVPCPSPDEVAAVFTIPLEAFLGTPLPFISSGSSTDQPPKQTSATNTSTIHPPSSSLAVDTDTPDVVAAGKVEDPGLENPSHVSTLAPQSTVEPGRGEKRDRQSNASDAGVVVNSTSGTRADRQTNTTEKQLKADAASNMNAGSNRRTRSSRSTTAAAAAANAPAATSAIAVPACASAQRSVGAMSRVAEQSSDVASALSGSAASGSVASLPGGIQPSEAVVGCGSAVHTWLDVDWAGITYRMHSFDYQGFRIWGLTAAILIEVAIAAFGRQPNFEQHSPGGTLYQRLFYDGVKLALR